MAAKNCILPQHAFGRKSLLDNLRQCTVLYGKFKHWFKRIYTFIVSHYAIREYRPRENVTFLENGTKVFATNPKSFVFLREMSVGDPEVDLLTTPNIPVIVSLYYLVKLTKRHPHLIDHTMW